MLIHDYLHSSAKRFPEKEAMICKQGRATYGELHSGSYAIASWLIENGLRPGERVAILMDDPIKYVSSYFGILIAGGVVVAMNTQTSSRTLEYQLSDCDCVALLTHMRFIRYFRKLSVNIPSLKIAAISGWHHGAIEGMPFNCFNLDNVLKEKEGSSLSCPDVSPSGIAQIIYTSGTTGRPNGVMLRHSNLVTNTSSIVEYLSLTENDRVMAVLPFFYSYGNSLLLTHFAVGGSLVVDQNFLYPNVVLEKMIREKVTGFSGVPSTFAILLNRSIIRRCRFPNLRYITQAGGAMSPKLARELKDALKNVDIYIMYGQTEASARLSYLEPKDLMRKAGSIGKAIPGVTLKVLDPAGKPVESGEVGEIVAQGGNIMAGYWGDPEKTATVLRAEGLWTGDLAKIDEEGYIYIVSRKSEIIKSGAHRISPKEVEDVLFEHPKVHEAAVVGVEDEILGEIVAACIVTKDGMECAGEEILRHCSKLLPPYKIPHYVEFLKELPKTKSGKVKKYLLKNIKKQLTKMGR